MILTKSFKSTNYHIAVLLLLLYIAPVTLFYYGVIPYNLRLIFLLFISALMIIYCFARRFTLQELGISKTFLRESLLWNGLYSLVSVLLITICFNVNLIRKAPPIDNPLFFYYYVLLSCPSQEFLYRSVIYIEFKKQQMWLKYFVIISTINYSFLHVIYHDNVTLAITFSAGLFWGFIYKKYPNFWGVALSHVVLGALSIVTGII